MNSFNCLYINEMNSFLCVFGLGIQSIYQKFFVNYREINIRYRAIGFALFKWTGGNYGG